MDYAKIKKLDGNSAKKKQEGTGPVDECICSLLAGVERKCLGASIKKVLESIRPGTKRKTVGGNRAVIPVSQRRGVDMSVTGGAAGRRRIDKPGTGRRGAKSPVRGRTSTTPAGGRRSADRPAVGTAGLDVPPVFNKDERGIYTTKKVEKTKDSCSKCGCDKENIVLKHSHAKTSITGPDVSSICPCRNSRFKAKANEMNNKKVTVKRVTIDPDSENSEASLHNYKQPILKEPHMTDKKSVTSLINAQYETDDEKLYDRQTKVSQLLCAKNMTSKAYHEFYRITSYHKR